MLLTVLVSFTSILLLIMIWLLLVPVQLIIDSDVPSIMIRMISVGSAVILLKEHTPVLKLQGFFLTREIPFMKSRGKSEDIKKERKKKKQRRFRFTKKTKWLLRVLRIPRSFRIKRINVNIDTGDYIINAYIFPVFSQLNDHRPGWTCSVNYFGRNQIYLILQTTLIRMLYIIFK